MKRLIPKKYLHFLCIFNDNLRKRNFIYFFKTLKKRIISKIQFLIKYFNFRPQKVSINAGLFRAALSRFIMSCRRQTVNLVSAWEPLWVGCVHHSLRNNESGKSGPEKARYYRDLLRSEIEIFDSKLTFWCVPICWSFEKLYKVSFPQIIIKIAEKNANILVGSNVSKNR